MNVREEIRFWSFLIFAVIFFSTATILQALGKSPMLEMVLGWISTAAAILSHFFSSRIKHDTNNLGEQ